MLKEIATQNYATSVCWGDERRLEASRQKANARVQAAMDMQAGCRLHSSRVQNLSVLSFLLSSSMFLQEYSHSYDAKAVVDDYFLEQPGDGQYVCGLIGGLIELKWLNPAGCGTPYLGVNSVRVNAHPDDRR